MENRPARRSILTNRTIESVGRIRGMYAEDDSSPPTSVFRSPSVEERLAQLGIELTGGSGSKKDLQTRTDGGMGDAGITRASERLNSDISRRISGISSSMDQYDKKVKSAQEKMEVTYRNTVQDRRRLKDSISPAGGGDESSGSLDIEADDFFQKCRESLRKELVPDSTTSLNDIEEPKGDSNNNMKGFGGNPESVGSPRKIFGLDAAAILDGSSDTDDSQDEEPGLVDSDEDSSSSDSSLEESPMTISIRQPVSSGKQQKAAALKRFQDNLKVKGKVQKPPLGGKKKRDEDDLVIPRSLSPIKPSMPDKQFQTMLERREERVSRHLTSMKNDLAQLNHKVELDKKKAEVSEKRSSMPYSYQGRPLRVMKQQPEKIGAELNAYIQSTGGPSGGWTRKDHSLFVKTFDLWRKHPNKLMETLKKDLPHKKSQDIAGHIKWYERFEQLSTANRSSVHQWSQEKRRESEIIYQMGSAPHRAKLEGDKRRQEHLQMIREQERDRGKEKLAQWKRTQAARTLGVFSSETQETSAPSPPSSAFRRGLLFQDPGRFDDTVEPKLRRPRTTQAPPSEMDLAGVRQHILDITAKVHSMEKPKRDFRPPRAPVGRRVVTGRGNSQDYADLQNLNGSKSVTNVFRLQSASGAVPRVKLPEIDPEPQRARPSSSSLRPPTASLIHQQQQRNRRLIEDFRERDSRLVEAKKKAVEIARDRRKSNLNQLTAEDVKRRIRSRISATSGNSPPTFLNPTKQSDLRKTITHLEKLEMLSKHDLASVGAQCADGGGDAQTILPNLNNLPSKAVPSWRRSVGGSTGHL